ncbi:hypothetical protein GE061_004135 [Apolygus lucorum]|uniref:Uncharacterized protein n=1 Tax=Apolygus lucorum TaxID=248454 RepID=A0A8S9WXT1_APOLU|nr:hypothetical protein GE061_004135 [Apolygus lucorum]
MFTRSYSVSMTTLESMRVTKNPQASGGGMTSDDESWRQPGKQTMKLTDNRRLVNPNFLFFCQIILLVIPITVLYAGLYFMNVSSPIIVVVCGVIIFGFLIVFICVRPFTTPEVKGEDSVPLTQDMSPSRKYEGTGIVTGRDAEKTKQPVPSCSQEQPKNHQTVQDALIESCVCPHNPPPHVMNQLQDDAVVSNAGSKTTLLSGKEISIQSLTSDSSSVDDDGKDLETAKLKAKNESEISGSNSGKSTSSSTSSRKFEKQGLLFETCVSDADVSPQNAVNFDMSNLLIDVRPRENEKKNRGMLLMSEDSDDTEAKRSAAPGTLQSKHHPQRKHKKHETISLASTEGFEGSEPKESLSHAGNTGPPVERLVKTDRAAHVKRVCRVDPANTSRSLRASAISKLFDDEPSAKRFRDESRYEKSTSRSAATKSRAATPEVYKSPKRVRSSSFRSDRFTDIPSPCREKIKTTALPITIRLFPKSSTKQGIFEWVEPDKSPESKTKVVEGLSSVIYNMQTIGIGDDELKLSVDESSQTILPLDTDTLHQMMVSSLKDRSSIFEDIGTQVTPTPEVSPKPSSVVYIVDEKKPSRFSFKTSEKEVAQGDSKSPTDAADNKKQTTDSYCQTLAHHNQQTSTTDIMVSKCNNSTQDSRIKLKDQDQQTSKQGTPSMCNDSILDFVMRRPFTGKLKNSVNIGERSDFKSSGHSFSDSKVNFHTVHDKKPKVSCNINEVRRVIIDSNTSPSDVSGDDRTPSRSSCHSSRELLKRDLPYVNPNKETWKIKGGDKQKKTDNPREEKCNIKGRVTPKVGSPKTLSKKSDRNDGRSKAFYSALYRGDNGKKYQPSKLGLLVTESSKEEVFPAKRKASVSPRIKKRSRIKSDDYKNNGQVETHQTLHKMDKDASMATHNKSPVQSNRFTSWSLQSPSLYEKAPRFRQESTSVHQQSSRTYQQPTVKEDFIGDTKLPNSSTKTQFFPNNPNKCLQSSSSYKQSLTTKDQSPIRKQQTVQELPIQKQESSRKLLLLPLSPQHTNKHETHPVKKYVDSQERRLSFPPFNLDFSSGVNDDDAKSSSPINRKSDRQEAHYERKRRTTSGERGNCRDDKPVQLVCKKLEATEEDKPDTCARENKSFADARANPIEAVHAACIRNGQKT